MEDAQNIDDILLTLNDHLESIPQPIDQINQILQQLTMCLQELQDTDYTKFGYYQYIIAEKCINSQHLNDQQRVRYTRQMTNHLNDYNDYLLRSAQNMLNQNQRQEIQYQVSLLDRQKEEGAKSSTLVANITRSAFILVKQKHVQEIGKTILRASSPVYRVATNAAKVAEGASQGAVVAASATFSKFNIIATLVIAAAEAGHIVYRYFQVRNNCVNQNQKDEAFSYLMQELKAFGARQVSTFCLGQSCMIAGAAIGSIFPMIGSVVGGIIGAIIGAIASYGIERYVIDPYFLKKVDFIYEAEREIGLESFKQQNGRDYTKQEFDQKIKRCLLNEHPDKFTTEALKKNARARIFKIHLSKELIQKEKKWN